MDRFNTLARPPSATARWLSGPDAGPHLPWTAEPLSPGATAARIERLRSGDRSAVRKWAPRHEIAALHAAQTLRPGAAAVPELIEAGHDRHGTWYTTPEYPGGPTDTLTGEAIDSLARLHAHFRGRQGEHPGIPAVTTEWWRGLCVFWVLPAIERHGARHGRGVLVRARSLVGALATEPRVADVLARITPTLLHGDVHPGNVLSDGGRTRLIDWGSARFGTPLLDLAAMVPAGSPAFDAYLRAHAAHGEALGDREARAGARWAALQIPVQYLPWQLECASTAEVVEALRSAEAALEEMGGRAVTGREAGPRRR
ncbi:MULTISPECIES: phosphotransferase family protein [unclassified Nocardiopsis]|uniref:phosphotransferase family protein n=1 Tax=Nocardiopsis TaxID=2013 RepID=UPI00387B5DD6